MSDLNTQGDYEEYEEEVRRQTRARGRRGLPLWPLAVILLLIAVVIISLVNPFAPSPEPTVEVRPTVTPALPTLAPPPTPTPTPRPTPTVPTEITVGGYVNQSGQGADGRSFAAGDERDYFVVDLTAGQTITLNTAESGNNIDLFLYIDQDFDLPVASSASATDAVEVIQVNSPGTYFIEVRAVNGASTYTLNITAATAGLQADSLALENDFVPGEVIVGFKDAGAGAISAGLTAAGTMPTGLTPKAGQPGRAMLFGLNGASAKAQTRSRLSLTPGSEPTLALAPELQRKLERSRPSRGCGTVPTWPMPSPTTSAGSSGCRPMNFSIGSGTIP